MTSFDILAMAVMITLLCSAVLAIFVARRPSRSVEILELHEVSGMEKRWMALVRVNGVPAVYMLRGEWRDVFTQKPAPDWLAGLLFIGTRRKSG